MNDKEKVLGWQYGTVYDEAIAENHRRNWINLVRLQLEALEVTTDEANAASDRADAMQASRAQVRSSDED